MEALSLNARDEWVEVPEGKLLHLRERDGEDDGQVRVATGEEASLQPA